MLHQNKFILTIAAISAFSAPAFGSTYFTDFTGFSTASDLAGQGGWTSNDSTEFVTGLQNLGGEWGSRAAYIGFATPSLNSVYVSHGASAPIVGTINASFSALFRIIDSDSDGGFDSSNRDTFGFRLENSTGDNLFSFFLVPFDQDQFPELDNGFHSYGWSTGNNAPTMVLPGFASAEQGAASYQFSVNFSQGLNDSVDFLSSVGNQSFSGSLPGLDEEVITKFGAFWNSRTNANENGSNYMNFDNVTLVPEPSAALLGLLGSFAIFRRRRA